MKRLWLSGGLALILLPILAGGQGASQSATTLASSSQTLQLPGNVTLNATVAPATGGGVPTGNVQFYYDGSNSLGSAVLSTIPGTESFLAPAIPVVQPEAGTQPFGMLIRNSGASKNSVLGILDMYTANEFLQFPEITFYSLKGAQLTQAGKPYQISRTPISTLVSDTPPSSVDAFEVGDFNHDGIPDLLLHGTGDYGVEYFTLPGTANGSYDQTVSITSPDKSGIGCDCSRFNQMLAVDDFNSDGYPDVAYAASGDSSYGVVGIALNAGRTQPGFFSAFSQM